MGTAVHGCCSLGGIGTYMATPFVANWKDFKGMGKILTQD